MPMTGFILTPTTYNRREVALMIEVALLWAPDFAKKVRERYSDLLCMADQTLWPSPEVLNFLELTRHEEGFVWQPR